MDKLKVIIENGSFMQIKRVEFLGEVIPVQVVKVEARAGDSPILVIQIGADRFEIEEEEIVEDSELEQPENDNF